MKQTSFSAVFPIILSENQEEILLHLRQNTGYNDGLWETVASGHVDECESAKQAAVRECLEEIGIVVDVEALDFIHLTHNGNYYHIYFLVKHYKGVPTIMEPEKNAALKWFPLNDLPSDMVPIRKMALDAWRNGISYTECLSLD